MLIAFIWNCCHCSCSEPVSNPDSEWLVSVSKSKSWSTQRVWSLISSSAENTDSTSLPDSEIPITSLMWTIIFCDLDLALGQFFIKWFLLPHMKHLVDRFFLPGFLHFRRNFHDPFFLERNLFLLKPFLFLNFLVLDDGLEEHRAHVHPGVGLVGHFVNNSLLMQILSRFFVCLICSWRNLLCEHILSMALRINWQSSPNVASAICLLAADRSLNVSSPSGSGIEERNACFRFGSLRPPIR